MHLKWFHSMSGVFPYVTEEEDLLCRNFTINGIADNDYVCKNS